VFLPLLKRDQEGRLVVVIRIAAHDPKQHKQNDVFKIGNMTLDWLLSREEDTTVYGVCAIFDMKGVSLGHARQLTRAMIRKAVHSWQVGCVNEFKFIIILMPLFINCYVGISSLAYKTPISYIF
jgi:hypothetical protein